MLEVNLGELNIIAKDYNDINKIAQTSAPKAIKFLQSTDANFRKTTDSMNGKILEARLERERKAEEARLERERKAEEARLEQEKLAEEKRIADQKAKEEAKRKAERKTPQELLSKLEKINVVIKSDELIKSNTTLSGNKPIKVSKDKFNNILKNKAELNMIKSTAIEEKVDTIVIGEDQLPTPVPYDSKQPIKPNENAININFNKSSFEETSTFANRTIVDIDLAKEQENELTEETRSILKYVENLKEKDVTLREELKKQKSVNMKTLETQRELEVKRIQQQKINTDIQHNLKAVAIEYEKVLNQIAAEVRKETELNARLDKRLRHNKMVLKKEQEKTQHLETTYNELSKTLQNKKHM